MTEVWEGVCVGGGGGVLKCRVSINGETRDGGREERAGEKRDGCRSALSDNGALLVGGIGT